MGLSFSSKKFNSLAVGLSIAIPLIVAVLIFMPKNSGLGELAFVKALPHLNGAINSLTSVILVIGFICIKQGKQEVHRKMMISAFILGALFLASYVVYHAFSTSTVFGDTNGDGTLQPSELAAVGTWRNVYLVILLSHIGLAVVVVPLVLFAIFYAVNGKFPQHKKVARWAFPIWLYVSMTGVVVYFMISQYY